MRSVSFHEEIEFLNIIIQMIFLLQNGSTL
jgi:hypothetical protein